MMHVKPVKLIATVLVAALLAASVAAADDEKGEAGQPGSWLYYGASVRSLALGGAYVAAADDAGSIFYNPAGLMRECRAWDIYYMHANPFYASRYNAFAVVWSRPEVDTNGAGGFFLGANSALGLGLIETRADDFERRSAADELKGTFGLYHQAAFLTWASRWAGTMGIADAGIGLKVIRQGLDGLEGYDSHTGAGIDLGLQTQLIHPPRPMTNLIPLRHLLPLRLGIAFQNIFGPKAGFGKTSEKYPFTIRWGGSYLVHVTDQDRILALADVTHTYWKHTITGWHIGAEYQRQVSLVRVMPRVGISREYGATKLTAGVGLVYSIKDYDLQFDFSPGFGRLYSELDNDLRFSFRVTAGAGRTAKYFYDKVGERPGDTAWGRWLDLQALACYPTPDGRDSLDDGKSSLHLGVEQLIDRFDKSDPVRIERYCDFLGRWHIPGYKWSEAVNYLRRCDFINAMSNAKAGLKNRPESQPDDSIIMKQVEAYLVMAETNASTAGQYADSAMKLLLNTRTKPELHSYFRGRCYVHKNQWDNAIGQYEEDSASADIDLKKLSLLGRAECLVHKGVEGNENAMRTTIAELEKLTNDSGDSLRGSYPPFPPYCDRILTDDGLYWAGRLYMVLDNGRGSGEDFEAALKAYAAVGLLYPTLDCAEQCNNELSRLLGEPLK